MNIKNIGIYAHVDAGKTTITENLLYHQGAIRHIGRVDNGDTQTDTMELEKKRGITIQATPISFWIGDSKINLIDTPGHSDFVAEVERSMAVLDGAILVISAKEGVQSHTNLLFEALSNQGKPIIIFVNKIDRVGVDISTLIKDINMNLTPKALPLMIPENTGNNDCQVSQLYQYNRNEALEFLADFDDELMSHYINNQTVNDETLRKSIITHCQEGTVYPILFGSALHGIGIEALLNGIDELLPLWEQNLNAEPSGIVFKVNRDSKNQKKTYVRVYNGQLQTRDYIGEDKITKMEGLELNKEKYKETITSGDIGILYGMKHLKVGEFFGECISKQDIQLGTPTMKVQIIPKDLKNRKHLLDALDKMAEEDPYLQYEIGDVEQEIYTNIFGEIQLEILQERLMNDYGITVGFEEPITIFKETPVGIGEAIMYKYARNHPFIATVGLRVEPAPPGKGLIYKSNVSTGSLPKSFQTAIEQGIMMTYSQGLKGWELTDIYVTLIHGEFCSVNSTPADFRDVTPMVFLEAVDKAKTKLLWPILKFRLKIPQEALGKAMSDLIQKKAVMDKPIVMGAYYLITGTIPAKLCKGYERDVIGYSNGRGMWITRYYRYDESPKDIVSQRKKIKIDPLNKGQYILYKRGLLKVN